VSPDTDSGAANPGAARNFALQLLARRDHCRAELALKLVRQGFDRVLAEAAVAELVEERLIDDERYVRNFVAYQARQGYGPARIGYKLRGPNLALDGELIDAALADEAAWVKHAEQAREKKFGAALPQEYRDKVKQAYFLQHRGFTSSQIRLAMGTDIQIDDWT
jgi:regulatory protein